MVNGAHSKMLWICADGRLLATGLFRQRFALQRVVVSLAIPAIYWRLLQGIAMVNGAHDFTPELWFGYAEGGQMGYRRCPIRERIGRRPMGSWLSLRYFLLVVNCCQLCNDQSFLFLWKGDRHNKPNEMVTDNNIISG